MSQLSLNLVAIAVFVVTMSTLLGPLVHLSPVFPAIATAAALGLAAVDTLGWQGRGAALLLDGVAGFSAGHRARIVRHEAGHFLVARLLDIPVTGYALSAWEALRQGQPGMGGVQFDASVFEQAVEEGKLPAQLVDRYCTIWMAGIAAEMLVYGQSEGGRDDREQIRTVLTRLGFSPQECLQKERGAILRAKTLLKEHPEAYGALINALEQRTSVEDCQQAIDAHLTNPSAPN